jgi:hypothetical protein
MDEAKVREIEKKIEDLKGRWPKHSLKPTMMQELEDLEAQLEVVKKAKDVFARNPDFIGMTKQSQAELDK